jgi:16S rRNA (adenine1518-N6/adenine1519-N6)-dimethyltransferase
MSVKPKKHLGQHFLKDDSICQLIVEAIPVSEQFSTVLEIGPGMGALTRFLVKREDFNTRLIEIDEESVNYLCQSYPELAGQIHSEDFLTMDLGKFAKIGSFAVVGNFPYNISSQILFKILDHKDDVPFVVGMFQKEVAERISEGPGSKKYGIISVLLQAYYDIEYLFTVDENLFIPPPKVKSGVIRLVRNEVKNLGCDEKFFKQTVKMAFNQRRKTLRNALKQLINGLPDDSHLDPDLLSRRAETLTVDEFIDLSRQLHV